MWRGIKNKLFNWLRLNRHISIKLYTGFAGDHHMNVYGHVLSMAPIERKKYGSSFVFNFLGLVRLFMVKPLGGIAVYLNWQEVQYKTHTEKDGFFAFHISMETEIPAGVYSAVASVTGRRQKLAKATADIIVPQKTKFAFISDIDDTFLISHSGDLAKRLFVLFTENAHSRKPFDGAVMHYRQLNGLHNDNVADNAFFYVSSSEWNLYHYINTFIEKNTLPKGVLLLNQIKTFSQLFATGQNNHGGKFTRIVKILETYPQQVFVLLGDDSQKDIDIYTAIVKSFPKNIFCVYIRRVKTPEKPHVRELQKVIEQHGVKFLYFAHSEEAIIHSETNGLVSD